MVRYVADHRPSTEAPRAVVRNGDADRRPPRVTGRPRRLCRRYVAAGGPSLSLIHISEPTRPY